MTDVFIRIRPTIAISFSAYSTRSKTAHNWLFFRDADDFDEALDKLIAAINADHEHVREHTDHHAADSAAGVDGN